MYIFLDESGQFTKHNDEKYFVVGSFTIGDQRRTDKAFRSWCRTKFPRKMRKLDEIKWAHADINDTLRLRTVRRIAALDIRIRYGYLVRSNIPNVYRKKGKIESGLLYTNIVGEILEQYIPAGEKEVHIFCDQRSLKGMTKKEFNGIIKARLLPLCPSDTLIQVDMIDSRGNANVQIADWISGALAHYLEKRPLGDQYFNILKNNFLDSGNEFFKSQ